VSRGRRDRRAPGRAGAAAALAAAILLTGALALAGQDQYPEARPLEKWTVDLSVGSAIPVGAFMSNLGHIGLSCDLAMGRRIGESPFLVIFDFSAVLLGYHSRHDYLSPTVPVLVEIDTSNNLIQGLACLKFQPGRGHARPYVEALAGLSYFYTRTAVYNNEFPWHTITAQTDFDYFTFCAGGGAGADFLFKGGGLNPDGSRRTGYRVDFKVRYLFGGRAKYLRGDSINIVDGIPSYNYRDSTTSMVTAQVGLVIDF